ncbi:P-loop containing nucleoside triphosphate hydrolase protein [Paraphysoderma sedebokerense]|nr:P-loop containing nucleoside triphosphate hydrolase protein [Paraphysoderma sedebokerense]KAI9137399.1 P-loop containing nucleoside triphosphate hydrolase protein [Paraphysoderma sedebokerense]
MSKLSSALWRAGCLVSTSRRCAISQPIPQIYCYRYVNISSSLFGRAKLKRIVEDGTEADLAAPSNVILEESPSSAKVAKEAKQNHEQNTVHDVLKSSPKHLKLAMDPAQKLTSTNKKAAALAQSASSSNLPEESHTFAAIRHIDEQTQKAIAEEFRFDAMTPVQEEILTRLPLTSDLVVQAQTGTGKTLAFLIAAFQTLIRQAEAARGGLLRGRRTSVLVISPTRELATQIASEGKRLAKFQPFQVHCFVGGTEFKANERTLKMGRADVVVGTPGRLIDLIDRSKKFEWKIRDLQVLILDEADRLLEMGFREDIEYIISKLPKERQTFLFSATYPPNVRQLADEVLKPEHEYIQCTPSTNITNTAIRQFYTVSPMNKQPALLHSILQNQLLRSSGKVIVFFPTTKMTQFYAGLLKSAGLDVLEIHSGLTQNRRTRISNLFRTSKPKVPRILLTSDVSARGVDYPDVSLVIQMGIASSKDIYVHRLGRTGRGGKEGTGLLMLNTAELPWVDQLVDIGIVKAEIHNGVFREATAENEVKVSKDSKTDDKVVSWDLTKSQQAITNAVKHIPEQELKDAYFANLGFYGGQLDSLLPTELQESSSKFRKSYSSNKSSERRALKIRILRELDQFLKVFHANPPNLPNSLAMIFDPSKEMTKGWQRKTSQDRDRYGGGERVQRSFMNSEGDRRGDRGGFRDSKRSYESGKTSNEERPRHSNREGKFDRDRNFEDRGKYERRGRYEDRGRFEERGRFEGRGKSEGSRHGERVVKEKPAHWTGRGRGNRY